MTGLQGCRVAELQGCRVAELQSCRVARFQGCSKLLLPAVFRLHTLPCVCYCVPMSAPYEKLAAWRFCHELALAIRVEARSWNSDDGFLASQIRRASHSAASNIVEGSSRRSPSDFRRFLDYSLASLAEVEYDLRFARDAEVMKADQWKTLDLQRRKAHGTTRLLYKAICAKAESIAQNGKTTR